MGNDADPVGKSCEEVGTGFQRDVDVARHGVVGNDPDPVGKPGEEVGTGFQLDFDVVRDGVNVASQDCTSLS